MMAARCLLPISFSTYNAAMERVPVRRRREGVVLSRPAPEGSFCCVELLQGLGGRAEAFCKEGLCVFLIFSGFYSC